MPLGLCEFIGALLSNPRVLIPFTRYSGNEWLSLPAEVVWYDAEDPTASQAAKPQVAYRVNDKPMTLLEAAASRAFKHLSEAMLDRFLADITAKSRPNRADKIRVLIDSWRHEWGWGDADVARAMMQVWPAFKQSVRPRRPPCREASTPDGLVWDDIHSVAEALRQAQEDENAATAGPAAPSSSGLQDAVLALREARAKRGKAAARKQAAPANGATRPKRPRGPAAAMSSPMTWWPAGGAGFPQSTQGACRCIPGCSWQGGV